MTAKEYYALQKCVAKNGLQTVCGEVKILDLAKEIVKIAVSGLKRIAPYEVKYLDVLRQKVLVEEKSPADFLLQNWDNSIEKVFEITAI